MGTDKGLLRAPGSDTTVLEALVAEGRLAEMSIALIGDAAPYAPIASEVPRVEDRPRGTGPLGGLAGALAFAKAQGHRRVVAVACDMPYVDASILETLVAHPTSAAVLAPKRGETAPWEPLLARYDVPQVAPVLDEVLRQGKRSFQSLFESLRVEPLPVTDRVSRALCDWDTPDDVPR